MQIQFLMHWGSYPSVTAQPLYFSWIILEIKKELCFNLGKQRLAIWKQNSPLLNPLIKALITGSLWDWASEFDASLWRICSKCNSISSNGGCGKNCSFFLSWADPIGIPLRVEAAVSSSPTHSLSDIWSWSDVLGLQWSSGPKAFLLGFLVF